MWEVKLILQKRVVFEDAQHSARASSCEKALPRVRHVFLCGHSRLSCFGKNLKLIEQSIARNLKINLLCHAVAAASALIAKLHTQSVSSWQIVCKNQLLGGVTAAGGIFRWGPFRAHVTFSAPASFFAPLSFPLNPLAIQWTALGELVRNAQIRSWRT